jgi:muconolactone delta-isomerase
MNRFMVVATFKPGTDQDEVTAMAPQEGAAAKALADEGVLNSVRVSLARDKVFLEVSADDADAATAAINQLPMVVFWDLEVYQVASPVG